MRSTVSIILPTVVGQGAVEGLDEVGAVDVGLAGAGSESDRLRQLRAVLPREVRVVVETHPLFGLLLASGLKRLNGIVHLVVVLPDGSAGRSARTRLMCLVW